MEPLKEMFNQKYFIKLAGEFQKIDKSFQKDEFLSEVSIGLPALSLNQRMRMGSELLKKYLPYPFSDSVDIMKRIIPNMQPGYTNLIFPDFVGQYGHDEPELSLQALKYFTRFGSSEFAIREFLKRDTINTLKVIYQWAYDQDAHVRRLASEGSRPRLPWSFKLDAIIKDPSLTRPILDALKSDGELYVRKSVANHLNDISKENPDYMLSVIKNWDASNLHTLWIIKHASRSLIKKGHAGSLEVFQFEKKPMVSITGFTASKIISLGQNLEFKFNVVSEKNRDQKLVIDYVIHYRKGAGSLSPKVFKLKEITIKPGEKIMVSKKQLIKNFTTRKHFKGGHLLEIQVNGKRMVKKPFYLNI